MLVAYKKELGKKVTLGSVDPKYVNIMIPKVNISGAGGISLFYLPPTYHLKVEMIIFSGGLYVPRVVYGPSILP